MTKIMKPIWRMNTGFEPSDKSGMFIFKGGSGFFGYYGVSLYWELDLVDDSIVYAYETTRTREAKRK